MDQPSDSGCLIDLDHAKKGKSVGDQAQVQLPNDDESIDSVQVVIRVLARAKVEREVARLSLQYLHEIPKGQDEKIAVDYAMDVVEHAREFRDLTADQLLTAQRLRWKQVRPTLLPHSFAHFANQVQVSYDFGFHPSERQKGSRTVRLFPLLTLALHY